MFAEKSFDLIKDLERQLNSGSTTIPTFDENSFRQVIEEMNSLFDQNQRAVRDTINATVSSDTMAGLHLRHSALERNKTCLLSYMSKRLDRIRDLRWMKGSVLGEADQTNMTEQEMTYFQDYNRMLATYMRTIGMEEWDGLDLTENTEPPKSHMVYFRVLTEYGEFEPEDGKTIILQKNSVHNLPRYQIEGLRRQGVIALLTE